MLAVRLKDKNEIYLNSTIHKANIINTRKCDKHGNAITKLQLVSYYNKYMGVLTRMMR